MHPVQVFSMPSDRILERIKGIKEGRKKPTELGKHSEREELHSSHTHWEPSYKKVSHLQEVSWIQAYWTASQDPQFTRLCDTDIEELAILLSGLLPSELLWRYDLPKDCSRNSCLRNKKSTRSKLSALRRNSLYLHSKNRTDGKRVASTAQQGLWHGAATATKIQSKDRKRQCKQLTDITADWGGTIMVR